MMIVGVTQMNEAVGNGGGVQGYELNTYLLPRQKVFVHLTIKFIH